MATELDTRRLQAHGAAYAKGIAQGLSLVSPTVWLIMNQGGGIEYDRPGSSYKWNVRSFDARANKAKPKLTREVGFRTFKERRSVDEAEVKWLTFDETCALNIDDIENNADSPRKNYDMWKQEYISGQEVIWAGFMDMPWFTTETADHPAGWGLILETGENSSYAGIARSNAFWNPYVYDYDALTIAANLLQIMSTMEEGCKRGIMGRSPSKKPVRPETPDIAVFNKTSWGLAKQFVHDETVYNMDLSGGAPRNLELFKAGFKTINLCGMDCFVDDAFGYDNGYIDAVAAEEFVVGHKKRIKFVTPYTRKAGLVKHGSHFPSGKNTLGDILITGAIAYLRTKATIVFDNPADSGLAIT